MIKEVLASVDLSVWAEASLLLFAAVFVAVALRTVLTDRKQTERHAAIVLSDEGATRHD